MTKTKNDLNWEKIFEKYDVLKRIEKHGYFDITATDINEFREARLMTKFDHKNNLPKIFKEHNLSILPTSRGSYRIGQFYAYYEKGELNWEEASIINKSLPSIIESIDINDISSEAVAINAAIASGILNDFLRTDLIIPTVDGRMGTSDFSYYIQLANKETMRVDVSKAQIEIDAGLETEQSLVLIEAKNSQSNTILIRQLYYPYRYWAERITKKVRPIYMEYFNGNFYLYEFEFLDLETYDSLNIVNKKVYSLVENKITRNTLKTLLRDIKVREEPKGVPFPQADDFNKIIIICEMLKRTEKLSNDDITYNFDFDKRQTDYYTNAAIYLGLVRTKSFQGIKYYALSQKGKSLMNKSLTDRQLGFIQCILEMGVFKSCFEKTEFGNYEPTNREIIKFMTAYGISYSESTMQRRAQTVRSWVMWINNVVDF